MTKKKKEGPIVITLEWLEHCHACVPGRTAFEETFGTEMTVTKETIIQAITAKLDFTWIIAALTDTRDMARWDMEHILSREDSKYNHRMYYIEEETKKKLVPVFEDLGKQFRSIKETCKDLHISRDARLEWEARAIADANKIFGDIKDEYNAKVAYVRYYYAARAAIKLMPLADKHFRRPNVSQE